MSKWHVLIRTEGYVPGLRNLELRFKLVRLGCWGHFELTTRKFLNTRSTVGVLGGDELV